MSTNTTQLILQRPDFDAIIAIGLVLLVVVMSTAWVCAVHRISPRQAWWAAMMVLLITLADVLGDKLSMFSNMNILPPPFVILVFASVGLSVFTAMGWVGNIGNALVHALSLTTLVELQIFRFPLELLMLRAAYLGIMPVEFSMLGYNLDVLTGVGALFISIYCAWTWVLPMRAIWLWNALGIVSLLSIAILAVLTSPNVHAFGVNAQHINSWVLYFPYSLLPTVLVSYAAFGHVLLSRKLHMQKHLFSVNLLKLSSR